MCQNISLKYKTFKTIEEKKYFKIRIISSRKAAC